MLVTSSEWAASEARLQRWQADGAGAWKEVGAAIPVTLGSAGLGWGLGLHREATGPRKREGDRRSPAGVFTLGDAFGYAASAPAGVRVRYRGADRRDYFVDDVASADYNQWRRIPAPAPNEPGERWGSFERMRREDAAYELGLVVQHNAACVPGAGSAIFVHVWGAPHAPTLGCTAMSKEDLLTLLRWLNPAAAPVLVQAPRAALPALRLR